MRSNRDLHAEIRHLRKRLDAEGNAALDRIRALETELGAEKARNAAGRQLLREQAAVLENDWRRKWRVAEEEISALRTGIGRESQRNLTMPCAVCSAPSGLKTNPVVLCLQCFRGTKKLPAVCGRECIAIGGGQFKCAREVGHPPGCQGVTQDGLLKTEDVGAAERRADPASRPSSAR